MDILTADIALPDRVVAFFTTRGGGVSDPPYHSLNLSVNVGDELDAVQENRIRLREQLPDEPMWLRQAHGSRVLRLALPAADSVFVRQEKIRQALTRLLADGMRAVTVK